MSKMMCGNRHTALPLVAENLRLTIPRSAITAR